MRARDVMTTNVVTVEPDTPVGEAVTRLTELRLGSLPVVEDGEVVGIVSEPDLLKHRLAADPTASMIRRPDAPDPGRTVADVMSEPVLCMTADVDVAEVAKVLVDNHVRAVPILDGGRLVGIVSRRDLLRASRRDDVQIADEVHDLLSDYASDHPGRRGVVQVDEGIVTVAGVFRDDHERGGVAALAQSVRGVVRVHTIQA